MAIIVGPLVGCSCLIIVAEIYYPFNFKHRTIITTTTAAT